MRSPKASELMWFSEKAGLWSAIWLVMCLGPMVVAGTIQTVAGTGTRGSSGDGSSATSAQLAYPNKIIKDAAGNLYIADTGNHRVRKITPSGNISTVAGSGSAGFFGDGGPATAASLLAPLDVAVDTSGNLFIADSGNNCIRKVSAAGTISTYAGKVASFHDGVQPNTPSLVDVQPGFSGDQGLATSAMLMGPVGVALNSNGDLYIADSLNRRIRKVGAGDLKIATVAGNGQYGNLGDGGAAPNASFMLPTSVAISGGDLYVLDTGANVVRKVNLATGNISTAVGVAAGLNSPVDIFSDGSDLYISDLGSLRIQKVSGLGLVSTIAGTGAAGYNGDNIAATSADLNFPGGIFVSSDTLLIADSVNQRIRSVSLQGGPDTVPPTFVSVSPDDNSWVTNTTISLTVNVLDDSGTVSGVSANGVPATWVGGLWQITISGLSEGVNTVSLTATDSSGNPAAYSLNLRYSSDPFFRWQVAHYGAHPGSGSSAADDPDSDGLSNYQEFLAGTVPSDSGSRLAVNSVTAVPSGMTIQWPSVPGDYEVYAATDLGVGDWSLVATVIADTALTTSWIDLDASGPKKFYKVCRRLP